MLAQVFLWGEWIKRSSVMIWELRVTICLFLNKHYSLFVYLRILRWFEFHYFVCFQLPIGSESLSTVRVWSAVKQWEVPPFPSWTILHWFEEPPQFFDKHLHISWQGLWHCSPPIIELLARNSWATPKKEQFVRFSKKSRLVQGKLSETEELVAKLKSVCIRKLMLTPGTLDEISRGAGDAWHPMAK